MKRISIKNELTHYIADNKAQFLIAVFSVFVGTVIGSLSAATIDSSEYHSLDTYIGNFLSAYNLQPVSKSEIFVFSVYNNFKMVLFMWLSGLWVGFIPVCILQLGAKGYKLGFSSAVLVRIIGGKGIFFVVVSLLPQIMISLPVLIVYTVFNINFAHTVRRLKQQGKFVSVSKELYMRNLFCLLGTVIVLLFCSFLDAYVIPPILKPICTLLCK